MKAGRAESGVIWWSGSALAAQGEALGDSLVATTVVLLPWVDREQAQSAIQTMIGRAGAQAVYLVVQDDLGLGPVALLNAALSRVKCEMVVYAAQDAFAGRYWLRTALACLKAHPEKGLLAFNDGKWFGHLAGFGLARRSWLDSVYGGDLFFRGYRQHYGDTELSVVAAQQGALAYDPHAMLIEVDHGKDLRTVLEQDRRLFGARVAHGFDARVSDLSLLSRFR